MATRQQAIDLVIAMEDTSTAHVRMCTTYGATSHEARVAWEERVNARDTVITMVWAGMDVNGM
jgi:hypothetical protein